MKCSKVSAKPWLNYKKATHNYKNNVSQKIKRSRNCLEKGNCLQR